MMFDNFGRHFGAPRVTFRGSVLKWGSQGPPEQKKNKKDIHFSLGRAPRRGPFWSSLAPFFRNAFFKRFLVSFHR